MDRVSCTVFGSLHIRRSLSSPADRPISIMHVTLLDTRPGFSACFCTLLFAMARNPFVLVRLITSLDMDKSVRVPGRVPSSPLLSSSSTPSRSPRFSQMENPFARAASNVLLRGVPSRLDAPFGAHPLSCVPWKSRRGRARKPLCALIQA